MEEEIGVQLFVIGGGPAFYISREIEKIIGNVIMNSSNWDVFRNIIFTKKLSRYFGRCRL